MWISKTRFRNLMNELDAATMGLKEQRRINGVLARRQAELIVELEKAKKWTRQRDPKTGLFVKRS
jgi:hypothetical protein